MPERSMPAMPAQAGAHLTKLNLLLQQAGVRARRALIGTRQQLRPLLHMVHADGKESVAGVPWGAGEKETTLALVPALMRAGDVVAYSILTEAWSATLPEGWKPSEPLPTAPSEGPDHPDVVIAAAYSRRRRKAVMWSIERDADGRCTDLVLMPGVDSIARGR